MLRFLTLPVLCLCLHPAAVAADPVPAGGGDRPSVRGGLAYGLDYEAEFLPDRGLVAMQLTVHQTRSLLRQLRFRIDPARHRDLSAEGELVVAGSEVRWRPPADGGRLAYLLRLDHERSPGSFDSLMREDWAVFRGDDLFPPAAATAVKGARSRARLRMSGPENWSFISAYPRDGADPEWFVVEWPDRRFDRPVGWMTAGRLGIRWGDVAGVRMAISGPVGHGVRSMDILAFLRWNLPTLVDIFPGFPRRILLVSAGDPMWRGGLSGPNSLYIHADRPLISGNGTSTLLHELTHLAQGYGAQPGEDWVVEALAEYYTLEIMRRSGTLSNRRYERGLGKLEEWGGEAEALEAENSAGPRTARGVAVMRNLDAELRAATGGKRCLDDVARQFSKDGVPVSAERLRDVAGRLAGRPLASIAPRALDREG